MRKTLLLLSIILMISQCHQKTEFYPIEETRVMMDTFIQIVIYDQQRPKQELKHIIDLAFDRIEQIDRITNSYVDSSLISYINQNADKTPVNIDSVLEQILNVSLKISEISSGAFDVTTGVIKEMWAFSSDNPTIPDSLQIKEKLKLVNFHALKLYDHQIYLSMPGMKIDLGGVAKGYAIDEAIAVLQKNGIKDALVNAGGDLKAICSDFTRGQRRVWIKHPRKPEALFGYFPLDSGSVATSGDYERFFIKDSVRYHHILDPKTGFPSRKCLSVTVQTSSATYADALATAIFVMGPEQGMIFVNKLPNVEALIIFQKNGKLSFIASDGLKAKFKINQEVGNN